MVRAVTVGDLARSRTPTLQRKVDKALEVIEHASRLGALGVSYSGGKDSTVTLDLVRRVVPDAPAAFFDSGCEYPGTYEMVEYYGAEVIKPQMSLVEMCKYGGYWGHKDATDPDAQFDFFGFLVAEPSLRFVQGHNLSVLALGLRSQECYGRRMSAKSRGSLYQVADGMWRLCPLATWQDDDVWAYIAGRGLRYNSAYDRMAELGMARGDQRVGMLLGMATMRWGRYAWLRMAYPELFYRLAVDFPKLLQLT